MSYVKLLTEIGFGIDLVDGKDVTAVKRAIHDIIHRVSLSFFEETNIKTNDSILYIKVYTPHPEEVSDESLIEEIPLEFKEIHIEKYKGGGISMGVKGNIVVAVVFLEIYVPWS